MPLYGSFNLWHFGLIVAPWASDALKQTRFLHYENKQEKTGKQKNRDLRHLALDASEIRKKSNI
jgi:hypothetical protein